MINKYLDHDLIRFTKVPWVQVNTSVFIRVDDFLELLSV